MKSPTRRSRNSVAVGTRGSSIIGGAAAGSAGCDFLKRFAKKVFGENADAGDGVVDDAASDCAVSDCPGVDNAVGAFAAGGAAFVAGGALVGAGTALIGADDDDAPPSSPMRLTAAGFSFSMAIARLLATIGAIGGSLSGATAGPVALDPTFSVWDVPAAADSPAPAAPNAFAVPDAAGVPGVTSSSREIRA